MSWMLIELIEELTYGVEEQEIMEDIKFISLYDYLGKAAGGTLGQQVFKYAKKNKVKMDFKEINQGGYSGKIICYPLPFLDEYFLLKKEHQQNKQYFE